MKPCLLLPLFLAWAWAAPDTRRFTCEECVAEMRGLGDVIYARGDDISDYVVAQYCPMLEDDEQDFCVEWYGDAYIWMLNVIVHHYFMDGAVHICQTMGICEVMAERRYTCEECVEGLEWVESYLEDATMVAEFTVYLEQNFCIPEWTHCKEWTVRDFPRLHMMAMEKFFIPIEICNSEPVCGGGTTPDFLF